MAAIEIRAPVRGETSGGAPRWIHIVFEADRHSNEQIEIADPRLTFDSPPNHHLYKLKQRFGGGADYRLSKAELAAFKHGCPRARIDDGGDADVRVLLGTTEQGSWELAYVLSCFAAAQVGRWRPDVRYVATGQIHDGRIRADLLADKLTLAREHLGRLVFLGPFEATPGGPRDVSQRDLVRVSSIAELWENPGSPLAAHADLEALTASIHRVLAPQARDVELTTRTGARDRPAIASVLAQDAPLILCGGTGAGKTSLLGRLAFEAARDPRRFAVDLALPPIALRRFLPRQARGVEPLLDCIGEVLFEHGAYQQPPRPEQVRALLCTHRALILFDGLNEVSDANREALTSALDGLLTLCPDHRYLMTDGLSPWFTSARWRAGQLLPMSDAQVTALLEAQPEPAASRLLTRPDLRELLRTPLLAVLLAESAELSGGLATHEQVIHEFVQSRFQRWARENELTKHSAAVMELTGAARRLAAAFGARAFTAGEAWHALGSAVAWTRDPVSALVACGFLIDGPGAGGTLEFRHAAFLHYFYAGAIAARSGGNLLRLKRAVLVAPDNEIWLCYLAVQLAPEPARAFVATAARDSPALGARLADTLADSAGLDPILASIARSAKWMRGLSNPLADWVVLGAFLSTFAMALLFYDGFGISATQAFLPAVVVLIALVSLWGRFTRVSGRDRLPLKRLLTLTLYLRPGRRVRTLLEKIVEDTARSRWVHGALRGYATVLLSKTDLSSRDAIELLRSAAKQAALASGILALEHLYDPRVAPILAHFLARDDLYSEAAARATWLRVVRFPQDNFWLAGGADPRVLAEHHAPHPRPSNARFFVGLVTTLVVSWLFDAPGAAVYCVLIPLAVMVDILRAGGRPAFGSDTWSGHSPWSYVLGMLLPIPMTPSLLFAVYLPRRNRILRTARGIDWQRLASEVSAAQAIASRAEAGPVRHVE